MADPKFLEEIQIDPEIGAIEIKITARAKDEEDVMRVLKSEHVKPESRFIYFYDTPDLKFFESGLVLRSRKVSNGTDDSTVKLRPVDASTVSEYWKNTPGFEIEIDAVGDSAVTSAKLSADQDRGEIDAVAEGKREIRKLFSKDQEKLITENRPAGVKWADLTTFGPVSVRKWEFQPDGFDYEVTVEEWVLPDESDLVELSVKADPDKVAEAAAQFTEILRESGIDTDGAQQTKTKSALHFFTTGVGVD